MLRSFLAGLAFASLALLPRPAAAFVLDFVSLAAGNEHSFLSEDFADIDGSGIGASVLARDLGDATPPFDASGPWGYLDDLFAGGDGGLGVCPTSDCEGSPDDNIALNEVAVIEFDTPVEITSIGFSNGVHVDVYSGNVGIEVGAANPTTAEAFGHIFPAAAVLDTSLTGSRFSFVADESFVEGELGDPSRLYLSSITFAVPEPAPLLLLGAGLAGLARLGRRRPPRGSRTDRDAAGA